MEDWLTGALAVVFALHTAAFSFAAIRRRRRGQSAARFALLTLAFFLLTLAQLSNLEPVREAAFVPEGSHRAMTWTARALFAAGLVMLIGGFALRWRSRRVDRT